jgi:hypothetical protein
VQPRRRDRRRRRQHCCGLWRNRGCPRDLTGYVGDGAGNRAAAEFFF